MIGRLFLGVIVAVVLDFVLAVISNKFYKKIGKKDFIAKGYHIHHSVVALIVMIVAAYQRWWFVVGFCVVLIFSHSLRHKRFVFIERIR